MSPQPMTEISLGWIAPHGGAGGATKKEATCECIRECGDDERVMKDLVKPCALNAKTHALRVTVANLTATLAGAATAGEALRVAAQTLVDVCDRIEPEVPHADRATDDELTAAVAGVKEALSSGLPAKSIEGAAHA
jgi:hypothetical protein